MNITTEILTKQYARRDIESLGVYYMRHVAAMTAEGLHEKCDIAAELAWRDAELAVLRELAKAPMSDLLKDLADAVTKAAVDLAEAYVALSQHPYPYSNPRILRLDDARKAYAAAVDGAGKGEAKC